MVEPAVIGRDEGEVYRLGNLEVVVKENGERTRGTHAVAEFRGMGFRIPPHSHTEHDETIYVLAGTLGLLLGDRTYTLEAGDSFAIPVGVAHSVWNETADPTRFLNVIAPGRYLSYFEELSLALRGGPLKPETMREVMGRYGLRPV